MRSGLQNELRTVGLDVSGLILRILPDIYRYSSSIIFVELSRPTFGEIWTASKLDAKGYSYC